MCVLSFCTIFNSILCAPWEEFSLTESNQQISNFYKGSNLKTKDSMEICEVDVSYQQSFIQ